MNRWASAMPGEWRFTVDGETINEASTPLSLGLVDGETIDVFAVVEQDASRDDEKTNNKLG